MAEAYLKAAVGPSKKEIVFQTRGDLVVYCRDWVNKWNWARQARWTNLTNTFVPFVNQFEQATNQLANQNAQSNVEQNARNTLATFFTQWASGSSSASLGPEDPRSEFVIKVQEKNGSDAGVACLAVFLGGNIQTGNPMSPNFFLGLWEAFLFKEGYTDPTPYEGKVLTDFMAASETTFSKLRTQFHDTIKEANDAVKEARGDVQTIENSTVRQATTFAELMKSSEKRLEDMERSFMEEMSLRAPVDYWQTKALAHKNSARRLGWAVALGSVLVLDSVLGIVWLLARFSGTQKPELWELGSAALVAGLLIYLLRTVVRVQLAGCHFCFSVWLSLE